MDSIEEFFYDAALSCYRTTKLFNFDSRSIQTYEKSLFNKLSLEAQAGRDQVASIDWDHDYKQLNDGMFTVNNIYIRCVKALYRICVLVSEERGVLILANSSQPIFSSCSAWISSKFDTVIVPLQLPSQFLLTIYNDYLRSSYRDDPSFALGTSELIFNPSTVTGSDLQKITVSIRNEDSKKFNTSSISAEDGDLMTDRLYKFLDEHMALDFKKLELTRVNCNGFIALSNGKLKFFKRQGLTEQELWLFIANLTSIVEQANNNAQKINKLPTNR